MRLSKNPDKKISKAEALASLKMMLASARSLDSLDPVSLARMYRVDVKTIEQELTSARQRREGQPAW